MKKVVILAVNANCEDKEAKLVSYLTRRIEDYEGFKVLNSADEDIDTLVDLAKKADHVIVVFDAIKGENDAFTDIATQMFNSNIRPILLISNSDIANQTQLGVARNSIANVWGNIDQTLDDTKLYFNDVFFSYEEGGVDVTPEVGSRSIEALIKRLS